MEGWGGNLRTKIKFSADKKERGRQMVNGKTGGKSNWRREMITPTLLRILGF